MKIGDKVKTVGGWDAQIIWICNADLQKGFYAIHNPNKDIESPPIYHYENGEAHSIMSVNEPPRNGQKLPADIILEEGKK